MLAPFVASLTNFAKRFARDERGAVTVEAVIWIPFFFMVLMLITDASLAFFSRAQAFRILESANRTFSITPNTLTTTTQDWVRTEFTGQFTRAKPANVTVETRTNRTSGTVATRLTYRAGDVVLFGMMGVLSGWKISVQSQQYVEWKLP